MLRDSAGREIAYQVINEGLRTGRMEIAFLAEDVPSADTRTYYLERADSIALHGRPVRANVWKTTAYA